jgi:hypothetical protein
MRSNEAMAIIPRIMATKILVVGLEFDFMVSLSPIILLPRDLQD